MAFGAKRIFPLDTRPSVGVGIALPFNAPGVFRITYTTQESIKYNLINFFPNIIVEKLDIIPNTDYNTVEINLYYSIQDTGINDNIQVTFT